MNFVETLPEEVAELAILPSRMYVKNLGPIREGTIEFSDFTVICGRQNTGKTYLALLTYALLEVITKSLPRIVIELVTEFIEKTYGPGTYTKPYVLKIIQERLDEITRELKSRSHVLSLLRSLIRDALRETLGIRRLSDLVRASSSELELHFTTELYILSQSGARLAIPCADLNLRVHRSQEAEKISLEFNLSDKLVPALMHAIRDMIIEIEPSGCYSSIKWSWTGRARAIYIPAERIGVVTSLYPMIHALLGSHRILEFEKELKEVFLSTSKPVILRFIRMFMSTLERAVASEPRHYTLPPSGQVVLRKVGKVAVLEYHDDKRNITLPFSLAPSGIVQLTPIAIMLEQNKVGLAVIEEPEINLHPDAHLQVAEWLTKFYKKGNVLMYLITTHSPFFLSKLALLYAKGLIEDLRVYVIQDDDTMKELQVERKTGEIELPRSMVDVYNMLAAESLELAGLNLPEE